MKKLSIIILLSITLISPVYISAQSDVELDYTGWVQCDGVVTEGNPDEAKRQKECNFQNLMRMVNYLINWLFYISIPIMVGLLAYAGYLYMTGKEANITKSHTVLTNAIVGFIIMLSAWFIVTTLVKWIVSPTFKGAETLLQIK